MPAEVKLSPNIPLYYIQHKGFCGNCLFWWRPDGCGYTCDLNQAWEVSKEEALNICKDRPKEDIPWLKQKADKRAQRHVVDGGGE